ncbi:hypothetical protein B0H16DRAFT_1452181 [Mycena metata]|uniref:Uncharacterized protein n=1 Tax=Mycena metata TaxID=1033252 RepID=A0AAD7JUG5_9AGAR|nr:hypothetical protein B0H16DRAFT_1452181 [Mycena metata]
MYSTRHEPKLRPKDLRNSANQINTLYALVDLLKISGLKTILNTTQSLLKLVQLLNAIIGVYIRSDTGAELPPSILGQIANFTETLHKIHTFVEAQQSGGKVMKFLRQGELSALLKDCKAGLLHRLDFFQTPNVMITVREMQEQAQAHHREVLGIIETMSNSDSASSVCGKIPPEDW